MAAQTGGWKDEGLNCLVLEEFLLPAPVYKSTSTPGCDVVASLEESPSKEASPIKFEVQRDTKVIIFHSKTNWLI